MNFKKIIFISLIILFFVNLFFRVWSYRAEYTTRFDPNYWKMRYNQSQWVVPDSKNSIGDDGLYAHAGWVYIHGGNPVLLNAEIPPLAKYIIGLSEIIFQNQNTIALLTGLGVLAAFYVLNLQLFKSHLAAFIPVFLFSIEPIFYSQLRAPYIDTLYLLFLLLTFLFILKKKYFVSSFFLGCFASTKYPIGSFFVVAAIIPWVITFNKKTIGIYAISLILWPVVFLLSYSRYFILGGSLAGFIGVQKWIVHFYSVGAHATPGIVYPMILTGNWYTWFAGVQRISEWTVIWPVAFLGSFTAAIFLFGNLKNGQKLKLDRQNMMLILFWTISYLLFLSFTPVFPRYLLLLMPFMYNLSIWLVLVLRKRYFGQ